MRIGVDTGGTFTDCVMFAGSEIRMLKVFSTPTDSSRAILDGVRRLAEGEAAERLDIIHGTTVGTNSVLERQGARVALVTTAGFEDLIEIGRQARPSLYDLNVQREPPLVPRSMRWGIRERTAVGGLVLSRPKTAEVRRLSAEIKRSRAEAIAVCFLFSFANSASERAVARVLRRLGIPVSVSHEILPEFREYERLSTVVINAYLAPRLGAYLVRLQAAFELGNWKLETGNSKLKTGNSKFEAQTAASLRSASIPRGKFPISSFQFLPRRGRVYVMQSSGGITSAEHAAREPVRTILSGPAGGVAAASWVAETLRISRAISFDMGGTSTDVCLLSGRPRTTHETTLGGLPVAVPVLDVRSVGAGGGSLARIDAGGALRVGPESSQAVPGPICYGRGGMLPTVTDANLLLGRLDPDYFLGGTFRLDLGRTEKAFVSFLRHRPGRPLSVASNSQAFRTPLELARGIISVVDANMEGALRLISVERGHDPRDYALICFGGAGGLHAADLARALGLARVIVPQNPGGFSALGALLSDIVKDVSQSVLLPVPGTARSPETAARRRLDFVKHLECRFKDLEHSGRAALKIEGFPAASARCERRLDVRYAGQAYELSIPFRARFTDLFHREHERAYGHAQPGRGLEVVNLRVRLTIPTTKPRFETGESKLETGNWKIETGKPPSAAIVKRKAVWFEGRLRTTPVYSRDRLPLGVRFQGPGVVVEYSSTTVVPPDYECEVDEYRNLVLMRRSGSAHRLIIRQRVPAPSPGPPRLVKAPAAVHPLPRGERGTRQGSPYPLLITGTLIANRSGNYESRPR
jgi:N-methylhydantoinase A